jgi:uncharacterized membrane protein
LTRHFFNLHHQGRNAWWIIAAAAAATAAIAVWLRPSSPAVAAGPAPPFAEVQSIIDRRCVPCHSLHPVEPGVSAPPAGIVLDTRAKIELLAPLIKTAAVDNHLMPPSNATNMTQGERDMLARWLAHR